MGHGNFSDAHVTGSQVDVRPYITGSGTAGTIVKFTAPKVIGDSIIVEAAGNIGIGTAAPGYALEIYDPLSAKNLLKLSNATYTNAFEVNSTGQIRMGLNPLNFAPGANFLMVEGSTAGNSSGGKIGLLSFVNDSANSNVSGMHAWVVGGFAGTNAIALRGTANITQSGSGTGVSASVSVSDQSAVGFNKTMTALTGTISVAAGSLLYSLGGNTLVVTNTYGARNSVSYIAAFGNAIALSNIYGETNVVTVRGLNTGTCTATSAYGSYNRVDSNGVGIASITNAYGVYIDTPGVAATPGTIINNYGLYIAPQGRGTTLDYAIYSAGGTCYFAGPTGIGSGATAPLATLDVRGTSRIGDGTTNYSNFATTGHHTMIGSARAWRDELGELIGKRTVGNRVVDNLTEGTVDYADNSVAAVDYKITNVQLNHDKDITASIYPHLHWFQSSVNVPNWLIEYRWQVLSGAKVTAWTPLACTTLEFTYTAGTTIHQICHTIPIAPPAGATISDIVQFRICRDTANISGAFTGQDPLAGNAIALMFDVHFQIDSHGSRDEYAK